jgi:hypothetical protein
MPQTPKHAKKAGGKRMADQKHLDILKQGMQAWNKWREEHPDIRPNLSGANLSRAHLSNYTLYSANLGYALQLHFLIHP